MENKISKHPNIEGTKQLFQNPFIEWFTKTHIAVPISYFTILSICLVYYSYTTLQLSPLKICFLFITGVFTYSLFEYLIHRFLYHSHEDYLEDESSWQYTMHGVHHEYPRDKKRLAMPLLLAIGVSSLFFLVFYLILANNAFAFFPGFVIGYAFYLLIHYSVHAYRPPRNFLRYLWKHHSIHHYKDHNRAFGVTSCLWDFVFGTMPRD